MHPEIVKKVDRVYRQLVISHWYTFKQPGGALKLWEYAQKLVRIQAEIDTIKLLQEMKS